MGPNTCPECEGPTEFSDTGQEYCLDCDWEDPDFEEDEDEDEEEED